MAIHGKATGIISGVYDITRFLQKIDVGQSTDAVDVTAFQAPQYAKEYIVGMQDATVSADGLYYGNLQSIQDLFESVNFQTSDVPTPFLVAYGGWLPGNRVRMGTAKVNGFDVKGGIGDAVKITGGMQGDGGVRSGVLLRNPTAISASENGPAVDNGVATTAGGRVQVHILDPNTRTANVTLIVQHSTNGSTWVDLQAVPVATTLTEAAYDFDIAGTINRYARIISTLAAGTGSVAYTAALARNT